MSKSNLIITIIVSIALITGAVFLFNSKNTTSSTPSTSSSQTNNNSTTVNSSSSTALVDPNGEYKLFSDPSIIKQPEKNLVFGNGQTITVEYDQSKGSIGNALFYKLYYVDKKGLVFQLSDSRFETRNGNVYSTSNKVFNSDADGLSGFLEIFIVPDAKLANGVASGTQLKLGMYPIKFETDKS